MEKASPALTEFFVSGLNLFTNIAPIILLYFFYGLAFLFLGVAIIVKDKTTSELRLANCLWLLAGFGFTHGAHEWLELYLFLEGQSISVHEVFFVNLVTVLVVALSFFFLLQFGLALIRSIDSNRMKWLRGIPTILFLFCIVYLWKHGFITDMQFFAKADILARNTFGLIGGLTTAYGLIRYSSEVKDLSPFASKNIFYAGIAFIFYSILAGTISSHTVLPYLPIPVEILRGISAVLIACFIIKALNIFDIETRKKIEQQLKRLAQSEKLASLGQLAAGIAHEINNPLTNASLNAQTLKNKLENCSDYEEILQKIDSIGRNVDRASNIARELLQFSRQRETEFVPVNINKVLTSALTLLEYKLKGITIHKNLSDVPDVIGDHGKLQQVFINILNNSLEAMHEGGNIFISTSHTDENPVEIKISDTGVGIPDGHILMVFDPFFTTKDVGTGTGLGLSICYGIITQHNGIIEISSYAEKGTTVLIKLPIGEGA